jgi:hypothetical protein
MTRAEAPMAKRDKGKTRARAKRKQESGELTEKDLERTAGGALTVKQKVVENPTGE